MSEKAPEGSGTPPDRSWTVKPYCLRCFEPLPEGKERCARCDFVSRRSVRRRRWNLNPRLLRTTEAGRTGHEGAVA